MYIELVAENVYVVNYHLSARTRTENDEELFIVKELNEKTYVFTLLVLEVSAYFLFFFFYQSMRVIGLIPWNQMTNYRNIIRYKHSQSIRVV